MNNYILTEEEMNTVLQILEDAKNSHETLSISARINFDLDPKNNSEDKESYYTDVRVGHLNLESNMRKIHKLLDAKEPIRNVVQDEQEPIDFYKKGVAEGKTFKAVEDNWNELFNDKINVTSIQEAEHYSREIDKFLAQGGH